MYNTKHTNTYPFLEQRSGVNTERSQSDAWGRPRNPENWDYYTGMAFGGAGKGITMRGYTILVYPERSRRKHLEMFSLINMNGRLYDPVLGRMLSPDNYIQAPDNTQSYNRYSYCVNNPLKYTDPSGDVAILIPMIIGAAISATINTGVQLYKMSNGSQQNFNWTSLGISTLAGGLGGIAGAYGGAAVTATTGYTSGAIYGAGAGFAGGAVGGFVQGGLGAGNAGWDWNNAWTGAAWGAAGGAIIGGTVSGLVSAYKGNSFWTGKKLIYPILPKSSVPSTAASDAELSVMRTRQQELLWKDLNEPKEFIRVRHHTSPEALKQIKASGVIYPARGVKPGVYVEGQPFVKPSKVNLGQYGKGAYVEFSVPKGDFEFIPGFLGGTGNPGVLITPVSYNIKNLNPAFVRWNWWNF